MTAIHRIISSDGRNLHAINQTFTTLLPKHEGATGIMDFRPIILIHGLTKIFAKGLPRGSSLFRTP